MAYDLNLEEAQRGLLSGGFYALPFIFILRIAYFQRDFPNRQEADTGETFVYEEINIFMTMKW